MELVPEWAPNIHPLLVHFPIAIILLAVLMDALNFFLPDKWWDSLKTTILYSIGAVSAIVTYYTGTLAADSVFLPSGAQPVLTEHAGWAWWTVWFFGIYALLRIGLHYYRNMGQKAVRLGLFAIALPGVFFLYETGDHGAELVFGYGAGTGHLFEQEKPVFENGNWSWEIGPDGVSTLLSRFRWLEGSPQGLRPSVTSAGDNYLLQLAPESSPNLFVSRDTVQNVQVDYYLDLSNFKGEASLVHHVHDARNYDFVTLSTAGGTISQGRVSGGSREVFAEESYTAQGMLFIRTVADGTHFRAYIDKEMAIHSHGEAPEAGSVGLRLSGTGTVVIDCISLSILQP